MTQDGVVLLHGIFLTRRSMGRIAHHLKKHNYRILNLSYPSTSLTIEAIATALHPRIDEFAKSLTGNVHFVGYSMGGLVTRYYLHRFRPSNLGRVVMIGTPNHGSEVADFVKDWRLYRTLYGPAGQQLVTTGGILDDDVNYGPGIIAGNSSYDLLGHMIIRQANDGKVSVESTKLPGMKDHAVVPLNHSLLPYSRVVWKLVHRFLEHQRFS